MHAILIQAYVIDTVSRKCVFNRNSRLQTAFESTLIMCDDRQHRARAIDSVVKSPTVFTIDFEGVGKGYGQSLPKSRIKTVLFAIFDCNSMIHQEFVPKGTNSW
ncbi:hypothetical protein NPIL_213311 [Nephila pilipes]|uniref:Uncharacterized protein n=1 Tax=Nephila pilipes TaxID=299642 RepID=A0A8X6UI94_NEPPI|nr:hypothetical protein NPIL_124271 [Nephila pilipes]GFT56968.1 hypothetical protein NPIL_335471 [Nephila pilipes]GFU23297.1 hypothetical protein NPIL_404441 [Nephila pilipes]GFU59553.1 hypothetical protein NPIL_213311 [Nephila pilipes]